MRRLYFLVPDPDTTQRIVHELESFGIAPHHIHLVGGEGASIRDVHPAGLAQTSDLIAGLVGGAVVGGAGGFLGGWLAYTHPPGDLQPGGWIMWVTAAVGAVLCMFVCGLIAADMPNRRLRRYEGAILSGKLLLIVDVPRGQVRPVVDLVRGHHPEADIRIATPRGPALA
jgi:uncharacterized membrane protein YeaQ/YmgE (transglycosylase-associated protein family)